MKSTKTVQSVDGDQKLYSGRTITSAGHKILDEVAHSVRGQAEEVYPGLAKY
jgi:ribosomal protein S19E (S16A)